MITFANGKSYEQVSVLGAVQSFQGQLRNTLAIKFLASVITLAEATELYKDAEALKEISISETYTEPGLDSEGHAVNIERTRGSVQLNFTLPVELTLSSEKISPTESAEIITIKLAQKSALELAQERQAVDITNIETALIELAEMEVTNNGKDLC